MNMTLHCHIMEFFVFGFTSYQGDSLLKLARYFISEPSCLKILSPGKQDPSKL